MSETPPTTNPEIPHDYADIDTLAKTLWGEARGEPDQGKVAVAWVIRNRASRPRFAGPLLGKEGAAAQVCRAPYQFSCWNEDDPNRPYLMTLDPSHYTLERTIAEGVLTGTLSDPTQGADHYHTIAAPGWAPAWPPGWSRSMKEVARWGGHVFYDSRQPA